MAQREIKFRVWDGERIHYPANGEYLAIFSGPGQVPWRVYDRNGAMVADGQYQGALMQYTDRKDVDGRDIYHGDLVELDSYPFYSDNLRNYVGEVYWCDRDYQWSVGLHVVSDRVSGSATGRALCEDDGEGWRIIGNIYENPELLTP